MDEDLDILAALYEKSKNPFCAWHAMRISLQNDFPLPVWAKPYFLNSANFLLSVPWGMKEKTQPAMIDALGLSKVGISISGQFQDEFRKVTIAKHVQKLREESHSRTQTLINRDVGRFHGLNSGQVGKIYAEYSPWLERLDKLA